MRILFSLLLAILPVWPESGSLHIYAIDVEGGKSTLYVGPSGESMLIDTGYAGHNYRDANRIVAAARAAGLKRIDNLVITHYHGDHVGGVPQLAERIPIGAFYDHGDNLADAVNLQSVFAAYTAVRDKHRHTTLEPGDTIPIKGLRVDVVSASGRAIDKPLDGAGRPNPLCSSYRAIKPDTGENPRSLAFMISFGSLRIADLGDLFWNNEHDLACPNNKLGSADIYMTTHHGTTTSGCPQIVHMLHPKVAIMNNSADKGGSVEAWTTIRESPGLADIWQIHFSNAGGKEHNVPDQFIANPSANCQGKWLEVIARADGEFTVINSRNGYQKTYRK